MKTIKKSTKEVVLEKYEVGQKLQLGHHWHDGRGETGTAYVPVTVIKDNKVTVDLEKANGEVIRFDKRGEFDWTLKQA